MAVYKLAVLVFFSIYLGLDLIRGFHSRSLLSIRSSYLARGLFRLTMIHGTVMLFTYWGLRTIDDSYWAKDIAAGKSFRLPELPTENGRNRREADKLAVLPTETDILMVPHYSADSLAGYGRVIDLAHPQVE